jgi:uncharacterized protein (DUF736 family)
MAKTYINHGAIWKKVTKSGKPMLSMKADRDIKKDEWINFFENDKGDNPKRPDYRAYDTEETQEDEVEQTGEEIAGDVPF